MNVYMQFLCTSVCYHVIYFHRLRLAGLAEILVCFSWEWDLWVIAGLEPGLRMYVLCASGVCISEAPPSPEKI